MRKREEHQRKAARIRRKRNELDMTQADLAQKVGVSKNMISKYERGESVFEMSAERESSLVRGLQTNEHWLNTGRGNDDVGEAMTDREINLVDSYREMTDSEKTQFEDFARFLRNQRATSKSRYDDSKSE